MLALCLMLSEAYHAQNYAGIIGLGLSETLPANIQIVDGNIFIAWLSTTDNA